ncbi:MAG: hypothetical protein AAB505_02340, partial [Patescibacteria group bacterium]
METQTSSGKNWTAIVIVIVIVILAAIGGYVYSKGGLSGLSSSGKLSGPEKTIQDSIAQFVSNDSSVEYDGSVKFEVSAEDYKPLIKDKGIEDAYKSLVPGKTLDVNQITINTSGLLTGTEEKPRVNLSLSLLDHAKALFQADIRVIETMAYARFNLSIATPYDALKNKWIQIDYSQQAATDAKKEDQAKQVIEAIKKESIID